MDEQTIENLRKLARLRVSETEAAELRRDLGAILDYVACLSEVDTTDIEPWERAGGEGDRDTSTLRPDRATPPMERSLALAVAPEHDGESVVVPRVL